SPPNRWPIGWRGAPHLPEESHGMRIGVLKETAPRERRVALTPDAVARLVKRGFEVLIERGAGVSAFFPDEGYVEAGARLVEVGSGGDADLVATVQRPGPDRAGAIREGSVLLALMGTAGADALEAL